MLSNLAIPPNFLYSYSTSTKGPQPGALCIKWSIPKKGPVSSVSGTTDRIVLLRERCADFIVYDRHIAINIHVAEVKVSEEPSIESEHNEQMLGLWKSSQKVMRVFEAYNFNVRPKILVLQKKTCLHM